jgi:hypothetical protein
MSIQKNLFLLILGLILLATVALGARVTYTAWYTQGLGGHPAFTSRHGTIAEEHVEPLLEHIAQWSSGKYTAATSRHNLITVGAHQRVHTKNEASQVVQDMVHLVCQHLKECGATSPTSE